VTQRIFAVTETWNGSDPLSIQHLLVGLNLADGSPAPGLPAPVDPPAAKPRYLLQRPGLALDGGRIVFGFGGNAGDCGQYSGWVASAAEDGGGEKAFQVSPGGGGAVWGAGTGLPVDAAGEVWAETGNGPSGSLAYQESVLKLDPAMNLLDRWTPTNWSALDQGDKDLGSAQPLLLPGGLTFVIGKEGVGTLLDAGHLGGVGAMPAFSAPVCSGGSYGGAIYVAGVIYVTCQEDGIHALALNLTARTFAPLPGWHVTGGAIGPPVLAGGLVWSTAWTGSLLYGLQPGTGAVKFSADLGSFDHFATPGAGGGRLFVAGGNRVTAFTIATPPPPSATSTLLRASPAAVKAGARLTLTASVGGAAGAPDGGTVAFLDGRAAVPGCAAVAVAPAIGSASCTAVYRHRGTHALRAAYSGDSYYLPSGSSTVTERVVDPPKLSRLRASVSRTRAVTLKLTLSEAAALTVTVSRAQAGHRRHGLCSTRAHTGPRCTLSRRVKTLHLRGHVGQNTLRLRLGRPGAGRYTIGLVATDANLQRSRRYGVGFRIK
jgi:hypothetical protein